MPLVDYSSSSSDDRDSPPQTKKRKTSSSTSSPLPPLPAAFHDLYAATVRTTPHDDPAFHQGRRRLHPHVAGHWPSHVYVEWHPTAAQHALLTRLVADVQQQALSSSPSSLTSLTSFLTSDLATPLPLHISLSRPLVLRTEDKDAFLNEITDALLRASSSSFDVAVHDLSWFRNPGGHRSFLVLRVRSSSSSSEVVASSSSTTSTKDGGAPAAQGNPPLATNPELTTLLTWCNYVVAQYGQSRLYSQKRQRQPSIENAVTAEAAPRDAHTGENVQPVTKDDEEDDDHGDHGDDDEGAIDPDAFHVSIAWSFVKPTPALQERTAAVFQQAEFQRGILGVGGGGGIKIPVDSVKVKIGNMVTSIALADSATTGTRATLATATATTRRGLFGI